MPDTRPTIGIVGCFQNGKSTLINCLLDDKVAMTGDGRATTRLSTVFNWGAIQQAVGISAEFGTRHHIVFSDYVAGTSLPDEKLSHCEVQLWKPLLQHVCIVDTPGFNDSDEDNDTAINSLNRIDFVVFLAQNKSLSQIELSVLTEIAKRGLPFTVVLNCKQASRGFWEPLSEANARICSDIESKLKNLGNAPFPVDGRYVWPVNLAWFWYATQHLHTEEDEVSEDLKFDIQKFMQKKLKLHSTEFDKLAELSNFLPLRDTLQRIATHWGHVNSSSGKLATEYIQTSRKYLAENALEKATIHAERACYIAPGFQSALHNRAVVCIERSEFEEAIHSATRVLEIDARDVDTLFLRAKAYFSKEEFQSAREDLLHIAELLEGEWYIVWEEEDKNSQAKKLVESYLMKMVCDQREGKSADARDALRHIIECKEQPLSVLGDCPLSLLIFSLSAAIEYRNDDCKRSMASASSALKCVVVIDGIPDEMENLCKLFKLDHGDCALSGVGHQETQQEIQRILWKACLGEYGTIEAAAGEFATLNELPVDDGVWKDEPEFIPYFISYDISNTSKIEEMNAYVEKYFEFTGDTDLSGFMAKAQKKLDGDILNALQRITFLRCKVETPKTVLGNFISITNLSVPVISDITVKVSYRLDAQTYIKKLSTSTSLKKFRHHKWKDVFEGKSLFTRKLGGKKLSDIKVISISSKQGTVEIVTP